MRANAYMFVATLAACSVTEKHPSDGDGGVDAGDIDASDRDVTGTSMLTHYTRSGNSVATTMAPEDLTIYTFSAYVPDTNEATGFRIISGTGNAQGQLVIPDVPMQPYYLRVLLSGSTAPTFYYTDDRTLQLGYGTAGRPGLPDVSLPSTINPTITGLDRGYDTDFYSLHSLGTGTEHYPIDLGASFPIGNVASLTAPFDWTTGYGWALPRMRPKLLQNDDLEILHHRDTASGNGEVTSSSRLIEIARMTGLTQTDGSPLAVSGAFTDVAPTQSVMASVQLGPIRQAYGNVIGVQEFANAGLGILLGSDPNNRFGPGLISLNVSGVRPSTTTITQTLMYGNPYDGTWALVASENYSRRRRVRLPGVAANQPGTNITVNMGATRLYTSGAIGATVQVGPPTNLRVGGTTAIDGVRTLGAAPITVQWTAVTNANRYSVSVRRVVTTTFNANPVSVGTFITTETSVSIPADLFAAGERYVFVVASIRDPLAYATGRLRAEVLPGYLTQAATGLILFSNTCGNGVREGAEECDTSGQSATCDVDCSLPLCLDGIANSAASEQCDSGFATPGCDSNCTLVMCGDGQLNVTVGEECEDSNMNSGDGCSDQCRWEASPCPDGVTQTAYGEECDDNNAVDTDDCVNCRGAFCGDGFVWAGNEQCDDGAYVNGDGCSDSCMTTP